MVRAPRPLSGPLGFGKGLGPGKNDLTALAPPSSYDSLSSTHCSPVITISRDSRAATTTIKSDRSSRHPSLQKQNSLHLYSQSEHIVAEIVVRTEEDMDDDMMDVDHPDPSKPVLENNIAASPPTLQVPPLTNSAEAPCASFSVSTPALSEHSELSSVPASLSSKATTPALGETSKELATPARPRETPRHIYDVRPGASIPTARELDPAEFARQCTSAAKASRLDPYKLHPGEYAWLRDHLTFPQVTNYLNLRNRILRLFIQDPKHAVTREEAVGCARQARWQDVASVCFDWLVRHGYINYGCVQFQSSPHNVVSEASDNLKQKTVVVIGAGMAGLGCARHLEGLIKQYPEKFHELGELPPKVIVLEGRDRIGGRVHSRELRSQPILQSSAFQNKRYTAEVGGMIITGFRRGNPLNVLVRGQLCLPYYKLRPATTLYDVNGRAVDEKLDDLVEQLWNFILDRLSLYKYDAPPAKSAKGVKDRIDKGEDLEAVAGGIIRVCEDAVAALSLTSEQPVRDGIPTPKVPMDMISSIKAELMGWRLKDGAVHPDDLGFEQTAREPGATLGSAGDVVIEKFRTMLDLKPLALRVLNWHIANHEYASAGNWNQLSLRGWDIDAGNEWRGSHTMVLGGYQSVPRGLTHVPTPLNVRQNSVVTKVIYDSEDSHGKIKVECEDGHTIEADCVVNTLPLGVLKHNDVAFKPALPEWKTGAVERLGFGTLNKIILVYKKRFWNLDRDFFGVLRGPGNSVNQKDYAAQRGHLFQWIDISNTTGMPCLLAFMAGDAANRAEQVPEDQIIAEATKVLKTFYGSKTPALPLEAFVTRWGSDRFARGTYSSAGPDMRADDYDVMARPVGNIFFAGEHTSRTHPATVHGAYLSGLRAAAEVFESMVGPLQIPTPLIRAKANGLSSTPRGNSGVFEGRDAVLGNTLDPRAQLQERILLELGVRPVKPENDPDRAFDVFHREKVKIIRTALLEGPNPNPNPTWKLLRKKTSEMWKAVDEEGRKEWAARAEENKANNAAATEAWMTIANEWDRKSEKIKSAHEKEHPSTPSGDGIPVGGSTPATASRGRRKRSRPSAEGSDGETGDASRVKHLA